MTVGAEILFFSNKQSRHKEKGKSLGGPTCIMLDLYTVYFRCTPQGYNGVYLSSKHCHKTAHSKELQGLKRFSNMKLDE